MTLNRPVYIVDPFGTTRDYDEGLYQGIREAIPHLHLLTTAFNDRRRTATPVGEHFFLRFTGLCHRRFPSLPLRLLKIAGAVEYFPDLLRLAFLARRTGAVVHFQWLPFPVIAVPLLIACRLPRPVIYTAHDIRPHTARNRAAITRPERWRYRYADRVVVHGASLAEELNTLEPSTAGKVDVIPHGLILGRREPVDRASARRALGLPADCMLVGFIGLLRPHKGLGDLLDAWTLAERTWDRSSRFLVIAGEWRTAEWRREAPGEERRVHDQIAGDSTILYRPGYLTDEAFVQTINAMDVIVLPYRNASQSGVGLAALRYQVPMIMSDEGALSDILPEQLHRWVIRTDDTETFASTLNEMLNLDESSRQSIRHQLRKGAERFGWSALRQQYEELYS